MTQNGPSMWIIYFQSRQCFMASTFLSEERSRNWNFWRLKSNVLENNCLRPSEPRNIRLIWYAQSSNLGAVYKDCERDSIIICCIRWTMSTHCLWQSTCVRPHRFQHPPFGYGIMHLNLGFHEQFSIRERSLHCNSWNCPCFGVHIRLLSVLCRPKHFEKNWIPSSCRQIESQYINYAKAGEPDKKLFQLLEGDRCRCMVILILDGKWRYCRNPHFPFWAVDFYEWIHDWFDCNWR